MVIVRKIPKEYIKTVDVIALGLLLHAALLTLTPSIASLLDPLFKLMGLSEQGALLLYCKTGIDIILCLIRFFLPILLICRLDRSAKEFVSLKPKFKKDFILFLIMTLGAVAYAGQITADSMPLFERIGIGFKNPQPILPDGIGGIITTFITGALVPAVTEELLFRKVILDRTLPYGKTFAIVFSSLCFSLIHTSPTQFLYAFTAGVFLAAVAANSGSVIPSMVIHFANNLLSIIYLILEKYRPDLFEGVTSITDTVLKLASLILICVLATKGSFRDKSKPGLEFPAFIGLLRPLFIFYVLFTVYLTLQWVYII